MKLNKWFFSLFSYKGKRIYKRDKNKVLNFFVSWFLVLFLLLMLLFYGKDFFSSDFNIPNFISDFSTGYFVVAVVVSSVVSAAVLLIFSLFFSNYIKGLFHRRKLARMIIDNRWYETTQEMREGFFKDISPGRAKTVITYFPRIYYKFKNGFVYINVEIPMGRYQKLLLNLENKIESGLFLELYTKELKENFVEYILISDIDKSRITIRDVAVDNGSIRLMKNLYWEYDKLPHMLIIGGVGGGKTYFILTLIYSLKQANSELYIVDPKNSDLADLGTVLPNVYHEADDIVDCIDDFCNRMHERNAMMKSRSDYEIGKNYADLGLPANFLIFDEYVSFMDMIGKASKDVMDKIRQIVMLGRQSGFFVILACQRPDAKYLGDGIRDQFNFRVALGRVSDVGYNMIFGDTNKQFFVKQIKGRGYVDYGENVISEFYSPLVPPNFDFLAEIKEIYKNER